MNFTCRMGIVGSVVAAAPTAPIMIPVEKGSKRSLAEIFEEASLTGSPSAPDIVLSFDDSPMDVPMSPEAGLVDFAILENALNKIVRNPADLPVSQLGILFANTMRGHPDAYGVMFDQQFSGSSGAIGHRPREGCAIFLDTIARQMPDKASFQKQRGYTTAHEVAHIFNQHHTTSPSYLRTSSLTEAPPDEACKFFATQKKAFARCSTDPEVEPGKTPFVGEGEDRPALYRATSSSPWELKIAIPEAFRPFEPMELVLSLGLESSARARTIRHAFHSGYERLAIWIQDPDGDIRRYRSPSRFCGYRGQATIRPGQPLVETVRIFGQAGGYTFRQPGEHRIWATYRVSATTQIRSNKVIANILGAKRLGGNARKKLAGQRSLLEHAARTLFYRSAKLVRPELQALGRYLETYPESDSVPAVHQAIGISLASHLFATKSCHRPAARQISSAEKHLSICAEHTFSRRSAEQYLDVLADLKKFTPRGRKTKSG